MNLQLRRYEVDGTWRDTGDTFPSLAEARRRWPNLERDGHPDLLASLGATRAYSAVFCERGPDGGPVVDHTLVAYRWQRPRMSPWMAARAPSRTRQPADIVWPLPLPGHMSVLPDGRSVLCHECGVPTRHAGLHARCVHGMSPETYRTKFRISNRTPLCAPSYSEGRRRSALRTGTARNVLPYRWRRRLPTRVEARQAASFDWNRRP